MPGRRWYAVKTLARQEKTLARELEQLSIPYYLPLRTRILTYRGRKATSFSPLFTGFVFIFATDEERRACLATGCATSMLCIVDQEAFRLDLIEVATALANEPDDVLIDFPSSTGCASAKRSGEIGQGDAIAGGLDTRALLRNPQQPPLCNAVAARDQQSGKRKKVNAVVTEEAG